MTVKFPPEFQLRKLGEFVSGPDENFLVDSLQNPFPVARSDVGHFRVEMHDDQRDVRY